MSFQLNQATQLERQRWTRHCSAPSRPQCLRSTAGSTGSESLFAFTGVLAQPPRWKRMPPLSARLWDAMPLVTQRCTGSFVCFFNTWSRFSLTRPRVRKVRSWKFARPPKFFYPKSYWNAVHSRPSKFAKPFEARRKYGTSPSASLTLFTGACWCGSPARASGMFKKVFVATFLHAPLLRLFDVTDALFQTREHQVQVFGKQLIRVFALWRRSRRNNTQGQNALLLNSTRLKKEALLRFAGPASDFVDGCLIVRWYVKRLVRLAPVHEGQECLAFCQEKVSVSARNSRQSIFW